MLLGAVDLRDVRMIEGGERLRFALESQRAIRITDEVVGQDFDGDVAIQFGIARAIDLAHAAFAQLVEDAKVSELLADHRITERW
jgi:hypothetical protein